MESLRCGEPQAIIKTSIRTVLASVRCRSACFALQPARHGPQERNSATAALFIAALVMPVAAAALTASVPLRSPGLLVSPAPPSIAGSRGSSLSWTCQQVGINRPGKPAFVGGCPGSDCPLT